MAMEDEVIVSGILLEQKIFLTQLLTQQEEMLTHPFLSQNLTAVLPVLF